MKFTKIITLAVMLAASATMAATDLFIYSPDGVKIGSGARSLPMQAVNIKTGKLVLGLPSKDDVVRGECGWYRILPYSGKIGKDQMFVATNYIFSAGTAQPIGVVKDRPKPVYAYSKYSLYIELTKIGKWDAFETWMKNTNIEGVNLYKAWDLSEKLESNNKYFSKGVELASDALGLSALEIAELLKKCVSGASYSHK